jgi:Uma2 family endonuclease
MSTTPKQSWTVESYLEFERASDVRHEYLNGDVFEMVGATAKHNLITGSTLASLYTQTRSRPCFVYPSDMRVKISDTVYTYPDISVVFGTPEYEDTQADTLLNPTLIIEVLSPSTERYDRGDKFQHYRTLDSLQEYVLISMSSYRIERYLRQSDGQWLLTDAVGLEAALELPSIGCALRLGDVYEKAGMGE